MCIFCRHLNRMHLHKLQCHTCKAWFANSEKLKEHKREAHQNRFGCDECGKTFSKKTLVRLHLLSNFRVHDFSLSYYSFSFLVHHISKAHDNQPFVCDVCDLSFINKAALGRHVRNDHDGTVYHCNRCEHQTTSKRSYYGEMLRE